MQPSERQYFFGSPGQRLRIHEWGGLDKPVVLLVHGFPGCAEHAKLMSGTPYWNSFRLLAMDRPGYGESDVQKKITPLEFARQVEKLLDDQGIKNISIISVSGGAPYSLAIAFLLKERVLRVSSVAGVAPISAKTFFFMNSQQKKAWALQKIFPRPVLHYAFNRVWKKGVDKMDELLFTRMNEFSVYDQKVLSHPELGPELLATTKAALQQGPGGVIEDMFVYGKAWGFDLLQVQCPVTFWHGTSDDIVHKRFSKDMSRRVRQGTLRIIPNEGHYSLLMNHRDSILKDVLNLD
ncbi:MAG: alpha/beta hydrolase [Bdellovibrionaceae bacterium]|nr:alpha/beta hydrolase [Pseudobdellovibrionaceae bacterium]